MALRTDRRRERGAMGLKILLVYLLGILLCQPAYIWGIRILCRMEDEDEELYCQDNGMVKKGKYVTLPRYHAGASFLLRSKSVE